MAALRDPSKATTMPQLIRAAAAAYGDDAAIRLKSGEGPDQTASFAALDRTSATIARGLVAWGAGKGSRVGFIFGNGPKFATIFAAITRIGAVAIPISTMIRANEMMRVLRQSDVGGVIVQREFLGKDYVERFRDALPELRTAADSDLRMRSVPYLRWIASTGADLPRSFRNLADLERAADEVEPALLEEIEAEVHPTDQIVEIYTSGSMALPKGVKHNHGPVLARAHYLRRMIEPTQGKEISAQLPMFWVGGLMMYLMPNWMAGAVTVCTDKTLSNSRFSVGAVLAPDDLKQIASKPYWGLGMTETLGPYAHGTEHRAPGRPLCAPMDSWADGFEHRVVGPEGHSVGEGGIGEIQLRGPAVTPALHKVYREDAFTPDGFLRTGDMVQLEGSRLHFTGRSGDMIKTDGSNVSPAEVEQEIQGLEGVHNAYVLGLPDDERGQLVVAAVVAREDRRLDLADLDARLRERLSSYKVPRRYFQIARDEIPMLASNKVARRQLAELLTERLKANL